MAFTFFDYGVAFILVASGLIGILRGLVREVLALVGWVVAFLLAYHFGAMAAQWMPETLPGGQLTRSALGFLAVFLGTWIVSALAGAILGQLLETTGLKPADRGLGLVFGLARGVLIVMLVVVLAGLTKLPEEQFWRDAVSRPYVMQAMDELRQWLPPDLAKYVKT
ncbi:membrane protein required for colicin V production [Cupriavidus sp. OV038]|jgi:membrane protein required for colicin V production|uniref:CvpA family protein n=1 Tax=unclassified Cupriavidus TaxID=2640874 RepID=UPI0008F2FE6C|nr:MULTISPECIES: CvpA family protein [unclassified Cupriavidus]SFB74266.1 membrane protein required for colicin V production [Cupriavidus sp. OV038]SFO62681.1 membrane protein required for colicin V production [Cupriavidus sp. OV096]